MGDAPPPTPAEARRVLAAALEAFRRLAEKSIAVAEDPKAGRAAVEDARHQATFALAAVGNALKGALRAARPASDP